MKFFSRNFVLLAFLPPEATYSLSLSDNSTSANGTHDQTPLQSSSTNEPTTPLRYKITFTEKAEWQHTSNEISKLEPYFVTTSRHNRIACLYVKCVPNPKYYILFSHGNAVDLG